MTLTMYTPPEPDKERRLQLTLQFPEGTTEADWKQQLQFWAKFAKWDLLLLGDAILYGEAHFHATLPTVAHEVQLPIDTLTKARRVALEFDAKRRERHSTLSFHHFYLVLGLDTKAQDRLLDEAAAKGQNSQQFQGAVMAFKASRRKAMMLRPPAPDTPKATKTVKVSAPPAPAPKPQPPLTVTVQSGGERQVVPWNPKTCLQFFEWGLESIEEGYRLLPEGEQSKIIGFVIASLKRVIQSLKHL